MEALISCMIAEGPAAKRPPHTRAPVSAGAASARCLQGSRCLEGFCRVMISKSFARSVGAALLPLALLAAAGASAAEPPKFAGLAGDFSPIDPPVQSPAAPFQDSMGQSLTL